MISIRVAALGLYVSLLVGCVSEPGSPEVGSSTGGVTLTVTSATHAPTVEAWPPAAGSSFVVLEVVLQNTGSHAPVPADFSLFSLESDGALVFSASIHNAQLYRACFPGTSIAIGGNVTCRVAFEVPAGQSPRLAMYDSHAGQRSSAGLPAVMEPNACVLTHHRNTNDSCPDCMSARCAQERDQLLPKCGGGTCGNCQGGNLGADAYCSCIESCAPSTCWTATLALSTCQLSKCGTECN